MEQFQEVFEAMRIWPIKVRMMKRTGYTLWASAGDTDLILAVLDRILVFKTVQGLSDFTESRSACNLSLLPSYQEYPYKTFITDRHHLEASKLYSSYYSFDMVKQLLIQEDWSKWSIGKCSEVLDTLNMLWDATVTINELWIMNQLDRSLPLGNLMNTLTFLEKKDINILNNFDRKLISDIYIEALSRLERRILYIC